MLRSNKGKVKEEVDTCLLVQGISEEKGVLKTLLTTDHLNGTAFAIELPLYKPSLFLQRRPLLFTHPSSYLSTPLAIRITLPKLLSGERTSQNAMLITYFCKRLVEPGTRVRFDLPSPSEWIITEKRGESDEQELSDPTFQPDYSARAHAALAARPSCESSFSFLRRHRV